MSSSIVLPSSVACIANVAEGWPTPSEDAFHGLAGDFVRTIQPHSESDPVAILVQFLLYFGNVIGRSAHFVVEADRHSLNLFATLVGPTAKGRKGSSHGHVKKQYEKVDPDWHRDHIASGLSSGEGVIYAVRDPYTLGKDEDPGVADKRLLVVETEFSAPLRVLRRHGNTLSPVMRQVWDGNDLRVMTRNSPIRATEPHISIIGHTSQEELQHYLSDTEMWNGFANRFLWICVRRSNILADGGNLRSSELIPLQKQLKEAVRFGRRVQKIKLDDEARRIWREVYPQLSEGRPGLAGAATSRAEAQVLRLACIYALIDRSSIVQPQHLLAALALWDYADASARFIFGDSLGNPVANRILRALRAAPQGLSRTSIRDVFGRHKKTRDIDAALSVLVGYGLAVCKKIKTAGRPEQRWFTTSHATKAREAIFESTRSSADSKDR